MTFQKIKSIKRIKEPTTVYNFHVPGPESFLANGVVTHNCYVPRQKGFANPITTFVNIEQVTAFLKRHATKQGMKLEPTAPDEDLWVYELGCNSDMSIDAAISDNVRDMVELFRTIPNAKCTWATKWVNRDLLEYDPLGKTRIRFSLMPHKMSKLVDVRTSPISGRIAAINDFVEAGYEVNVNFSPVIVQDGFLDDYDELFEEVNDSLGERAKAQLEAEIIFLTHNAALHEVNLQWHPTAEEVLWTPHLQEAEDFGWRRRERALQSATQAAVGRAVSGEASREDAVLRGSLRVLIGLEEFVPRLIKVGRLRMIEVAVLQLSGDVGRPNVAQFFVDTFVQQMKCT